MCSFSCASYRGACAAACMFWAVLMYQVTCAHVLAPVQAGFAIADGAPVTQLRQGFARRALLQAAGACGWRLVHALSDAWLFAVCSGQWRD